ncbi:MAG: futalosine hydrolase [Bacteroidia bacterium]
MKKTLIVAATLEELAPLYSHFGWQPAKLVEHLDFDLLITGVGMTATAFEIGRQLSDRYDLVLNVGIAGSFDRTIPLGTVVNVTHDTFAELGAEDGENFIGIDQLGYGKGSYQSSFKLTNKLVNELPLVKGITVNTVHGNSRSIEKVLARLDVQTESMEGAAVYYACEQMNIPTLQVRSISNYVERRNRAHWEIGLAIKNLNDWLISFLNANFA